MLIEVLGAIFNLESFLREMGLWKLIFFVGGVAVFSR